MTAADIYNKICDTMTEQEQECFRIIAKTHDFDNIKSDFDAGHLDQTIFLRHLKQLMKVFFDQWDPGEYLSTSRSKYAFWNPVCDSYIDILTQRPRAKRKIETQLIEQKPTSKRSRLEDSSSVLTGDQSTTRRAIYLTLLQHLRSAKHVFDGLPGCSHIKCNAENCHFCQNMYKGMKISRCTAYKHPSCIEGCGWFPHVGPDLWATLQSRHDSGLEFKIRLREVGDSYLPPLQTFLTNLDLKRSFVPATTSH